MKGEYTMNIRFEKATTLKEKPQDNVLGFGKYFTDHMFLMNYDTENG